MDHCLPPPNKIMKSIYGGPARLDRRHIMLGHRHIQLALKYIRTWNIKYCRYLCALLKPQRNEEFRLFEGLRRGPSYLKAKYSIPTTQSLRRQYEVERRPRLRLELNATRNSPTKYGPLETILGFTPKSHGTSHLY